MATRRTVKKERRHGGGKESRRRGGGKEGHSRKKRSVVLRSYTAANIGRMALANIAAREKGTIVPRNRTAAARSRLNRRMRGLAGRLTRKLGRKAEKEARTGKIRKYKREKLGALISFLERLDELDDMALETDNDDLRTRLSIFTMAVMGELEEVFGTIKEMLPGEDGVSSDIDDLIGAISGMTVEDRDSMEGIIEDAKDILEALRDEYQDEDIMEEAREMYGTTIDLLVEKFIAAIKAHEGEFIQDAPANNVSGLLDLFSGLGL